MFITQEIDYALRILRSLMYGGRKTVAQIAREQMLPLSFAYKIQRKLDQANYIASVRGVSGGCELIADLNQLTLLHVMECINGPARISACMEPDYNCPWREQSGHCSLHCSLIAVQQKLIDELNHHSLAELLGGQEVMGHPSAALTCADGQSYSE